VGVIQQLAPQNSVPARPDFKATYNTLCLCNEAHPHIHDLQGCEFFLAIASWSISIKVTRAQGTFLCMGVCALVCAHMLWCAPYLIGIRKLAPKSPVGLPPPCPRHPVLGTDTAHLSQDCCAQLLQTGLTFPIYPHVSASTGAIWWVARCPPPRVWVSGAKRGAAGRLC
jgi:hypothetical protein